MMQVDDRNKQGQYYIKVMNKIVAKGDGHVDKEIARLSKMIDAKAADSNKLDDFEYRVNILNMFKAGPVEEKEVGEDASEDEVEHEDL
jgi:protein disulfide-isomerase A6